MVGNALISIKGYLSEPLVIGYKDLKPNKEAGPLETPNGLHTRTSAVEKKKSVKKKKRSRLNPFNPRG